MRHDGQLIMEGGKDEAEASRGDRRFLMGWMIGTPGGKEALDAWLAKRGIKHFRPFSD